MLLLYIQYENFFFFFINFRPSLVSNPKVINISYLIAILVCLFVYSGLYFSWEKSLIFELIIMVC